MSHLLQTMRLLMGLEAARGAYGHASGRPSYSLRTLSRGVHVRSKSLCTGPRGRSMAATRPLHTRRLLPHPASNMPPLSFSIPVFVTYDISKSLKNLLAMLL